MTATMFDVLDDLRESSLDERDKGDKFERLVKAYFTTDPEWTARFDDVWLWSEWEGRDGIADIGVDLVAKLRDSDQYAAIQCKFYDEGRKVAKSDIDSFIAASGRTDFGFVSRYVVDTSAGWTGNLEKQSQGQVQRIGIEYLADAPIDWKRFSWSTPEVVVPTGPKTLRPHQQQALDAVRDGLATRDRGKLIMACGTGKTFTSLKIAEGMVGEGGSVLFLVPSIQLLSQSLREYMANAEVDIRPFAVCSDVRVGRQTSDDGDLSVIDLTEPATTDAATLLAQMSTGRHATPRMTVVFATYQSIEVVIEAQRQGLAPFDLVICDEAHRTTGVTLAGQDESAFVKVHDDDLLKADKRLYMTATPRVFGDDVRKKATDADAVLADMGDEDVFGPELHRLGFGDAVEAGLLTDYKVLVLAVDEAYVADNFQRAMAESGEIKLDEAAKLIGCWNGLAKNFGAEQPGDRVPMRTAVAFAQNIKASQNAAAAFPVMADRAVEDVPDDRPALRVEARHVDGTMRIRERNRHLNWLKEQTSGDVCRILTNAKCLSEGVDVPALDAVMFLTPRGSQVDVVQSVGRVMRKSPGKELGYIILPVVVPSGVAPEEALRKNDRYKVVWQVLQALRSHDDRFQAMVNKIELNKNKPTERLDIIPVTGPLDGDDVATSREPEPDRQLAWTFPTDEFRDAMYARVVQKVGERRYWETWARDVADIAAAHVARINGLLNDDDSVAAYEFEVFLDGLRGNLNESVTPAEAVDMLAQHLVTKPIFDALFGGYDFARHNPVAQAMERMLDVLGEHRLDAENVTLEGFYASVRRRVAGVDNAEGKQRILIELYDKFFSVAFKKTVDRLGIVYTPVEIVDFILRSADAVLRQEFGQGLTAEGVHVLDGFTGTGTFLVRLLQSSLIEPHDLARKYARELHGNEILLLAYYIACVNIEQTYLELAGAQAPFPGLVLTDTFQSWEPDDRPDLGVMKENNARLERLKSLPITVIVGNPPYSSGQDSANDDNANESYPKLDEEIRSTYAERSSATNKNSLYDSYIRAIKWASLRIEDRGVIAFVTNGGWLDSNTADGMRQSLAEEFSAIHVYNLRGNQRTAGEQSRKEGGKVFGGGSRATVAITVLVKKPRATGPATIHYTDIGDYLSREEKLSRIAAAESVLTLPSVAITPNEHGDWLNQRSDDFEAFLGAEEVFDVLSGGVKSNRDAWVYNFGTGQLAASIQELLSTYADGLANGVQTKDPRRISWSGGLEAAFKARKQLTFQQDRVGIVVYRPFSRMRGYFDATLNERRYRLPQLIPTAATQNFGIVVPSAGSHSPNTFLMIDAIPDLHVVDSGRYLGRYRYEQVEDSGMLDFGVADDDVVDSYRRIDNITDEALARFRQAYPGEKVDKDDIFFYVYGLLHSPQYRQTYAADLKKSLPRIPFVRGFRDFVTGGGCLSELHLGYESVEPYRLSGLDVRPAEGIDPYDFYAVGDKKMRFGGKGREKDRSTIHYNDRITVGDIPDQAYRYQLGSRSAVEWVIDRYHVKTDKKSGIVNDPNDWSREVGDPRYILDLLARVVTVSVETVDIVDHLPDLDILETTS
ncbi:MAG: DEAD/DEAH box helicase family protein [Aeromicrobium sp.]|uniref:DEAD/DEAH box helicase n=1 Tax=Aeromicrobium sp. TaxID=1871063 RepID=UPI0039E43A78